jgi:DNA-binding CsgD family transcriptional regulator
MMRFFVPNWQMVKTVFYDGSSESKEEIQDRVPGMDIDSVPEGHYVMIGEDNEVVVIPQDIFEALFHEKKGPLTDSIAKRRIELRTMGLTDMQAATVSYSESGMSFSEIADALSIELGKKVSQQTVRAHYVRGKPKMLYDFKF